MLKPETILALFEDGSEEALNFALPYAADMMRKIIKKEEDHRKIFKIPQTEDTTFLIRDGQFYHCNRCKTTVLIPNEVCVGCGSKVIDIVSYGDYKKSLGQEEKHEKSSELCTNCLVTKRCREQEECYGCSMSCVEKEGHIGCRCDGISVGEYCPYYIKDTNET